MDIVMLPFHDCKKWIKEGYRTRDAHLAEHFCMDERVGKILVINRPTSMAEMFINRTRWRTKADNAKIIQKGRRYQISQLNDKTYCLDIFLPELFKVIKQRKLWWFSAFQNKIVLETIKKAINNLKLKDTVLLLQNPMAIGAVQSIDYNCFAFDAIDNWLHHQQMKSNRSVIAENYKFVESEADVIFTVSQALTEVFSNNSNVNWVANGVDTLFFSEAISKYDGNTPITVGYVGKIQDRVDFDLVEECLKNYPAMQFVFMGPVYSQNKRIKSLKKKYTNIIFTGDVHYDKLPMAMKQLDIAIIPHKVDAFTDSMNPLKLYEYLAAGKAVVSTSIAGTENISKFVYTTDSNSEFVKTLGMVANEVKAGNVKSHDVAKSIPSECSWTYRCNQIVDILEQRLKNNR